MLYLSVYVYIYFIFFINGTCIIFMNVSVSTKISGSAATSASFGRIDTSGKIIENGTSVTDHGTAMAIVFGG